MYDVDHVLMLDYCLDINEAVDSKRLHHQLLPMQLRYEEGFEQVIDHQSLCNYLLAL